MPELNIKLTCTGWIKIELSIISHTSVIHFFGEVKNAHWNLYLEHPVAVSHYWTPCSPSPHELVKDKVLTITIEHPVVHLPMTGVGQGIDRSVPVLGLITNNSPRCYIPACDMSHRVALSHGMWQQECDQITYLDSFYGQIILQNTSVGISPVPIVPKQHIFLDTLCNGTWTRFNISSR